VAVVTYTPATLQTRTTFLTPPDVVRQTTAIPRAILNHSINADVLPAKPINDQLEIQIIMSLPTQFAYRMIGMTASADPTNAQDYGGSGYVEIQNALRPLPVGQAMRHAVQLTHVVKFVTPRTMWIARMDGDSKIPTYVLQSVVRSTGGAVQPTVAFKFTNQQAAAALAGSFDFLCQFYEYDIEQVQLYPPLVPTLTYAIA